jgi:transposase
LVWWWVILFFCRGVIDLVAGVGGVARFYPKKNSRLCSKGSSVWRVMFEELVTDPQRWLSDYHRRFNVEGCFPIFKRDNPLSLRKKLDERKQ